MKAEAAGLVWQVRRTNDDSSTIAARGSDVKRGAFESVVGVVLLA